MREDAVNYRALAMADQDPTATAQCKQVQTGKFLAFTSGKRYELKRDYLSRLSSLNELLQLTARPRRETRDPSYNSELLPADLMLLHRSRYW